MPETDVQPSCERTADGRLKPGAVCNPRGPKTGVPMKATEIRRRLYESALANDPEKDLAAFRDADPKGFWSTIVRLLPQQVDIELDHQVNFVTAEDASRIASQLLAKERRTNGNGRASLPKPGE